MDASKIGYPRIAVKYIYNNAGETALDIVNRVVGCRTFASDGTPAMEFDIDTNGRIVNLCKVNIITSKRELINGYND